MLLLLQNQKENSFCIKIDYSKDTNPATIFQSISELVSAFEKFDFEVSKTISVELKPSLVLEEVGSGSVYTWLASRIRDIDDEALKKCDYQAIVGKLLVELKYWLLTLLENKETLNQGKIEAIQKKLNELIEKTQIKHLPTYNTVSKQIIIETYIKTAKSISILSTKDDVSFSCIYGQVKIKRQSKISEEILEDLLVAKANISEEDVFLKIKKPDYLGESRWLFHLNSHPIEAKMDDQDWLESFRKREVVLRPGDSLHARLNIEMRFDEMGNPLPTKYTVIKVYKIIEGSDGIEQNELFD